MNFQTCARALARRAQPVAAIALAASAVMTIAAPAYAMRVSPMVSEITATGSSSSARIEVQNMGSAALPFETKITRIDYDEKGEVKETPADEDFLVFPPQGLIPVSGRQVVRVQWVGDPALKISRAYYVSVNQLPVALDASKPENGAGAQLQIVYHMKALVVVAPKGAEPKVEVVSAKPVMVSVAPPTPKIDPSLSGGKQPEAPKAVETPGVEVRLRNTGARYALMSGANWIIEGTGTDGKPARAQVTMAEINASVGVGYLAPAGGERTFQVPTGTAFAPGKPITIRFTQ